MKQAVKKGTRKKVRAKVWPPAWGAPEWGQMSEAEFAEAMVVKMQDEPAGLTLEAMDDIEKFWEHSRASRRCALVMVTRPFQWLEEKVKTDDQFARSVVEVFEACGELIKAHDEVTDNLRMAHRAMMVALSCREDMCRLIADREVATA